MSASSFLSPNFSISFTANVSYFHSPNQRKSRENLFSLSVLIVNEYPIKIHSTQRDDILPLLSNQVRSCFCFTFIMRELPSTLKCGRESSELLHYSKKTFFRHFFDSINEVISGGKLNFPFSDSRKVEQSSKFLVW